jgi:hypothetical protein
MRKLSVLQFKMKRFIVYFAIGTWFVGGITLAQNNPSTPAKQNVITFDQGKSTDPILKQGDYIGAIWAADRFSAVYGIVQIVTQASEATKGEYEIKKPDGSILKTRFLINKSRPAFGEELKTGMLVICWNKDTRREFARFFLCIINKTDQISTKKVEVKILNHDAKDSFQTVDLDGIRIIESPQLKFILDGPNYIRIF